MLSRLAGMPSRANCVWEKVAAKARFVYNVLYIMLSFKKIITMATSTATKENFFLREQMQNTVNTNKAYKPKQDEFIV